MTEAEREQEVWLSLGAYFGSIAGLCGMFFSVFWRFVVFPPMLVVRYDDGCAVWGFRGEILSCVPEPSIPAWANVVALSVFVAGACVFYIAIKCYILSEHLREGW